MADMIANGSVIRWCFADAAVAKAHAVGRPTSPPTSVVTGPAVKSRSVFGALPLFIDGAWSIKPKAFRVS